MQKRSSYKQFWFLIIKLSIVVGAGYFIYQRVFYNSSITAEKFVSQVQQYLIKTNWIIIALVSISLVNWLLEILKWKVLVGKLQHISFYEACKQSLSSHTLSLLTPFKLGEYGGKALYFAKHQRKKVWLLNFGGNAVQLLMTLLFGLIGFIYFINRFQIHIEPHRFRLMAYVIAMSILFVFGGVTMINKSKRDSFYKPIISFISKQSYQNLGIILFVSFLRYVLFSHQFYFLLLVFEMPVEYEQAMLLIFTMYFLATLLPSINLFDFVIKGSVAIYLFSFLAVDELIIISISLLMWLLNFALPALLGSYFVLVFKTNLKPS